MRLRLPVMLVALLFAGICSVSAQEATISEQPTTTNDVYDLGNVMFVGDSITHGVKGASWRWALHKILVDNGITYNSEGVKTGNDSGGISPGTTYGGVAFNNVHSAQSSARAYEIAGSANGTRFNGSNIKNWLGQSTTTYSGSTYTGDTFTGSKTPDTFFLMIGTNDLLSDNQATLVSDLSNRTAKLLSDMDLIINSMTEANNKASIYVMTIPCWTTHPNANTDDIHKAVQTYNQSLTDWGKAKENVKVIDINKGMIDVAFSTSFFGVSSMFNSPGTVSGSDGLHPNAQGNLILAGNLAKAMGYAGRSAGQVRRSSADLATHIPSVTESSGQSSLTQAGFSETNVTLSDNKLNFGSEGTSSLSYTWGSDIDLSNGFCVDFGITLGDGDANTWNTSTDLSLTLGNGSFSGTLNINEAYIKWGSTVLYSADMSANTENLRVAYVDADSLTGVDSGYYVWLGDMLIGEALAITNGTSSDPAIKGLSITYSGSGTATIFDLALDNTGSYAPTSSGIINSDNIFLAGGSVSAVVAAQGNIDWKEDGFTSCNDNLTATSGDYKVRDTVDSSSGSSGNSIGATITSGSSKCLYANSGSYTGDVWVTIAKAGGTTAWYGGHGGTTGAVLNGDVHMRFTEGAVGGSTVFGTVNTGSVNGNVYLEFSADNATFGSFTTASTNAPSSVVGAYQANITGKLSVVVNAGTFNNQILGGIHTGSKTIGGGTEIFVNGGTINGDVVGGGRTGTIEKGTAVTVTGGKITGSVYGAGKGDTINGNTAVLIQGGDIQGNIYAGGASGTVNGNTSVTIDGSQVRLGGNKSEIISGGGTDGMVVGSSVVELKDIIKTTDVYGMDKYVGTLDGGANVTGTKTLVLDHVTVGLQNAQLTNFTNVELENQTSTILSSLGGATSLTLGEGCGLELVGKSDLAYLKLATNSFLSLTSLTAEHVIVDITGASGFVLTLTEIPTDVKNIQFKNGENLFNVAMAVDNQANTASLIIANIPEPGSVGLGMLGLMGLLLRRKK